MQAGGEARPNGVLGTRQRQRQRQWQDRKFQANQLTRFMEAKGPRGGCINPVFYASYVFLEKLRIKEGRPKTQHREDMEKIWDGTNPRKKNAKGMEITQGSNAYYTVHSSERLVVDKYGQIHFVKR
ncbi:hypothetical protein P8C59_006037 [Phyllachora maydis]|uniref:DUF7726 domain-containing protein n=1 Tax=Phyllachora maydis TaxID=1825666 RepID=A0AAD9I6V3_9PEZI|nr:hypothetical protein P8C59_006037 [Phyllachora maydis]